MARSSPTAGRLTANAPAESGIQSFMFGKYGSFRAQSRHQPRPELRGYKAIIVFVRIFQACKALFCWRGRKVIIPYDVIWRPLCCHYEEAADAPFIQACCDHGRVGGCLKSLAPASVRHLGSVCVSHHSFDLDHQGSRSRRPHDTTE